jgi:hypothetical protein
MIESDRNMQQQGAENLMAGLTSAMGSIAGSYMEAEERKAKGRAFKNTFNVLAPALNMTTDKLAQVVGTESLKNDNDWYQASEAFMPILPSLINLQLGQDRLGVQQAGQQIQAGMPAQRARVDTLSTVAGGGGTVPLQDDPAGYAPSAPPGTGATQAASAWYNQSRVPTSMSGGAMKPFWK